MSDFLGPSVDSICGLARILIHNGNVKFNFFGLTKIKPESLRFLTNILGQIQYINSIFGNFLLSKWNFDSLNNIAKGKREMIMPGTSPKYNEISTDCRKLKILIHNGNVKFNFFGLTKIKPESLRFLTNILGQIQYINSIFGNFLLSKWNFDSLNNIAKGKREMIMPGTSPKYNEISTAANEITDSPSPIPHP
ncbi:hypothetical protein Glove_59g23 [Diversispora epigaea]|uniref:Uncharacterized protein n=1 Tax=Diversispora epigaea TaxID=1348612 RepID=A0A397JIR1_9GLOM|nr:hypothetical protein Glove_59g23 [Diversispora epigaea]